jgi:hypothetical protein
MMTSQAVLIMAGDPRWHVGHVDGQNCHIERIDLPDEAPAKQIAEAVAVHLSKPDIVGTSPESEVKPGPKVKHIPGAGLLPGGVVLGVPSGWCLCGTVLVSDLAARQKHTAMLFALEELLPITAEQVVADFIVGGETALGVAAETHRLRKLVKALEDRGIPVDAICPTALLALQHLTTSGGLPGNTIAWRDPGGLNHFELDPDKNLTRWRWLTSTTGAADQNQPATLTGLSDAERQWLAQHLGEETQPPLINDTDLLDAACFMAAKIRAGKTEPTVNLRRDELDVSDRLRRVRGHLMAAMATAAVLLLAVSGVFQWRAREYRQADHQYDAAVTALYQDAFGDQPRPTSVKRRFATRLRERQGLAGQQFDGIESTEKTSALWLLHDLLDRMPTDLRLCLLDIRIEHDSLAISGQARSHSEADRIAAALRRDNRFEVEPPSTAKLKDGGVSFTLHCRPTHHSPPAPTEPASGAAVAGSTTPGHTAADGRVRP